MSGGWKRPIVNGGVVLFALWPIAQLALVARYDVNPWKLGGFGMYSTPQLGCYFVMFGRAAGATEWVEIDDLPPELEEPLDDYLRLRRGIRELAEPDGIARLILERRPALERLAIEVRQLELDRRTGWIEERIYRYEYGREYEEARCRVHTQPAKVPACGPLLTQRRPHGRNADGRRSRGASRGRCPHRGRVPPGRGDRGDDLRG
jgi:hypothetical protein